MSKLMMMRGLPASGKSTFAIELVSQGWKRVNKDDLRAMIDNKKWSKTNEKQIIEAEDLLIIQYLDEGYNVVVDDTNFAPEHEVRLREIAENCGAEFEVNYIGTPLIECIRRNLLRGETVPTEEISKMYRRYVEPMIEKPLYNTSLLDAYIFDIDGTLALMKNRGPFEWNRVGEDIANIEVIKILHNLRKSGNTIVIVSGRDSVCGDETKSWLTKYGIPSNILYMRPEGDNRPDTEIKKEIYDNHIKGNYNVLGVFDDRDSVVALWRSLGLTCLQVAYGSF